MKLITVIPGQFDLRAKRFVILLECAPEDVPVITARIEDAEKQTGIEFCQYMIAPQVRPQLVDINATTLEARYQLRIVPGASFVVKVNEPDQAEAAMNIAAQVLKWIE